MRRSRKSALKKKILIAAFFLAIVLILGTALFVWISRPEQPYAPPMAQTIYPAQYSDRHITENAKIADPKLQKIARVNKQNFFASVLSAFSPSKPFPITKEPEKGTWLWTPLLEITPAYRKSVIEGAEKNGIRTIYLSLDSYLDIYALPVSLERDTKEKAFDAALEDFIAEASAHGIAVDAEGGWRNWAEKGHTYKAFALLDYAIRFNETHAQKLRGFQYDVEPYLLDSYQKNKIVVLHDFVDLINESVTELKGSDLLFSVVIPEFYDGTNRETPKFFYGLRYAYAVNHLLEVLERRPGSKIIVMSYRNFAEGENGTIDITKDEIAAANGYQTKIVVAQETGDVPPPFITFYDTSRSRLNAQVKIIEQSLAEEKSYDGVAYHYINALMQLR